MVEERRKSVYGCKEDGLSRHTQECDGEWQVTAWAEGNMSELMILCMLDKVLGDFFRQLGVNETCFCYCICLTVYIQVNKKH